MASPFALYRVDADHTTEASIRSDNIITEPPKNIENLIDFDGTRGIDGHPDEHTKLISFQPMVGRFRSRNPAPFSDATVKQDVGFEGIRFILTILFNEQGLTTGHALGKDTLFRWSIQRSTIRADYPHGTIGMRNDWSPEFNIQPSNKAGLKITSYQYLQEIGMPYLTRGEITLEFSGDPNEVWFNE